MCGKLRAALDARRSAETLIMARTDAIAVEGIEAAFERAEAYAACGVDALFIEALRTASDMDAACRRFGQRLPLLANMVEGGRRRCKAPTNWRSVVFASSFFPVVRRGSSPGSCKSTSRVFASTAPRGRCKTKCSTSMA